MSTASGDRIDRWIGNAVQQVEEKTSLPAPPERLRRGPFRVVWHSSIHSTKVAARLGAALGVTFTVCFLTGLLSHAYQSGLTLPARPVDLYRVTQGLHVITGIISVPLLLGKLAAVYPRFWEWPPVKGVVSALDRLSLLVLVGGAIFQLSSGVFNIAGWYAFGFFFTSVHYWVAWVTIGALGIHIMTKLPLIKEGLRKGEVKDSLKESLATREEGVSR